MRIGVPREQRSGEHRVAASPDTVKRLIAKGVEVLVERGAGARARFADQAFTDAGARLIEETQALYREADVVLKVRRPLGAGEGAIDEMTLLRPGQVLIGMLNPYQNRDQVAAYAEAGVTAFALELLPRTTRAQSMDVLSSQANLAGYRALIDGLAEFDRVMPMLMTAAGTVPPAKVFVIGAGVAGLQAIATARRLGAVVSATDIRPAAKEEIESLGAKFVGVVKADAATAGGYARELSEEDKKQQAEMVAQHIKGQDLVITTAQIPGRPAPRLVSRAMVESMKPGSVLVDLAVESGGNVEGSQPGQVVEAGGVKIVGHSDVPSRLAPATSALYARNLFNFVELLIDPGSKELVVNEDDELIKGSLITRDGKVVHPSLSQHQAA
ncbi:MAG: Re/Si-specific transhydrogenase subunit alpha [Geminicoccaceae bacterium]|nr:Re/Si-specific transhydrogenase subunit alpha [Geminicoccaceae bacterium]